MLDDATHGWDVHGEVADRWSAGFARWVGAYSERLERASPTLFPTEQACIVERTDRHTAAQFAARLDTDCRGQESGPAWAFVEDGQVRGIRGDNQCGGCGHYGEGWHTSEVLVDPEPGEAADALKRFETETHDLREQQAADAADEALRGVETAHRWLDTLDADDVARAKNGDPELLAEMPDGSDMEPGVFIERGREGDALVGWDWDPRSPGSGEIVEVRLPIVWADIGRQAD